MGEEVKNSWKEASHEKFHGGRFQASKRRYEISRARGKIGYSPPPQTWGEILKYERLHPDCLREEKPQQPRKGPAASPAAGGGCAEGPKLLYFYGRAEELSWKAFLSHKLLGKRAPFDRHQEVQRTLFFPL